MTNENQDRYSGFEHPEAGWAVYKMVSQNGRSSYREKVLTEQPFSSRENCEKRAEELNRENPNDQCYVWGREDLGSPIRFSKRFRDS
jgi:hypothetical protein